MTKAFLLIGVFVALFIVAACNMQEEFPIILDDNSKLDNTEEAECTASSDCEIGGCSGEICNPAEQKMFTTCEYREEYSCYKLASCGCVNGKCSWQKNEAFDSCFAEKQTENIGGREVIV